MSVTRVLPVLMVICIFGKNALAFNPPILHLALRQHGTASLDSRQACFASKGFMPRRVSGAAPLRMQQTAPKEGSGDKNADITLGQYTGLKVQVVKAVASEAEILKYLKENAKDYTLEAARSTDGQGGSRLGHTVLINFQGFDPATNQELKGTKANMYELELKEGHKEPWQTFTKNIAQGMGQDEMKSFLVTFPSDYQVAAMAGKPVRFECYVKSIKNKVPKDPDTRPEAVQRAEVVAKLEAQYERLNQDKVDAAVRDAVMQTCKADTTKATEAVSWAKFGERSTLDFQWQLIKEAIGRAEGIKEIDQIEKYLRDKSVVEWSTA